MGLSRRQVTHKAQEDNRPMSDIIESIMSFYHHIDRIFPSYDSDMILNMDETPIWFDLVKNETISVRGTKSVEINNTGKI